MRRTTTASIARQTYSRTSQQIGSIRCSLPSAAADFDDNNIHAQLVFRMKRTTHDVVPTADGESHAVSDEIRIRVQRDVRRGVIAVCIPVSTVPVTHESVDITPLSGTHAKRKRRQTDIASDPSPVKDVGNLTSKIPSYHRYSTLAGLAVPWISK
jgi:hypothetical protein